MVNITSKPSLRTFSIASRVGLPSSILKAYRDTGILTFLSHDALEFSKIALSQECKADETK
uniref:Uncharacterized protein n=1 Tax=Brassica oleracea var. oleracea TaxID=109376 RepID=A0A0D3C0A8_BRAOL